MSSNDNLIVPMFKTIAQQNDAQTKLKGRPVFDDLEIVEIRMAANKQTVGVFPAHEVWKTVDMPDGTRVPQTYAERFADKYQQFKAGLAQSQSGTPVEELPFLTQSQRSTLKALNVHTAETLAALDGQPLKNLGPGGRTLKDQAQAYLDAAHGSADTTRLIAENADLRDQMAAMQAQITALASGKPQKRAAKAKPSASAEEPDEAEGAPEDDDQEDDQPTSTFAAWGDDELKEFVKTRTGSTPRGNPNHETLVRMADEIVAREAADDEAAG